MFGNYFDVIAFTSSTRLVKTMLDGGADVHFISKMGQCSSNIVSKSSSELKLLRIGCTYNFC